jgi:23S rRNA (cytosine1962-C5)-methyltransferase
MVANTPQYQLMDFGAGRKLERFGQYLVDRPCPSAERLKRHDPSLWESADARFDRTGTTQGQWTLATGFPDSWTVAMGRLRLEFRAAMTGQVGFFPEQMGNWTWIEKHVAASKGSPRVLNLFGYTGGASLVAAAAGAEVVHVDSAKSAVSWARQNAVHSRLGESPIRWIVDDAAKFVQREIRRGNTYDGIILDPPSYGHGPKGQAWKLDQHLGDLLGGCAQLVQNRARLVLLTCHTPHWGPDRLRDLVIRCFPACAPRGFKVSRLHIRSADGRSLPSGTAVRWLATESP